jgi:hypothetical protein
LRNVQGKDYWNVTVPTVQIAEEEFDPDNNLAPLSFLIKVSLPNFKDANRTSYKAIVRLDQTWISFLLLDYQEKHGHYPQNLADIRSFCEGQLPIDPFSGNDYIYRS